MTRPQIALRRELRRLINSYWVSQALHVVGVLGIADQLAGGARSSQELARILNLSEEPLYRLLRAVATTGVFEELPEKSFRLTDLGEGLRSDVPGSLAGWAAFMGRRYEWDAWSRLIDGVRTGDHPFRLEHGTDVWSYRRDHAEEAVIFNAAMNSMSGLTADSIASGYDFAALHKVVDVGGGGGALIAAILLRHPHLRGVLFDMPHIAADSASFIDRAGLSGRCELVGGSFFEEVPAGGDAYLIKSVLHDWYDEDATRILQTCRAAMRPDGKLLVVERVVEPPNEGWDTKFADLNMLVSPGGRERTRDEWDALLRAGGFDLVDVKPLEFIAIIEAQPSL